MTGPIVDGRHTVKAARTIGFDEELEFLRRPETYGGASAPVTVIETHKSWVFLTNEYVYKLKKAIRYDSIDFRPLAIRRFNCHEEVRLNRRLARDVYLDAVPITIESDGKLALNGVGQAVDWLVKMRRLPAELMMDWKIYARSLGSEEVVGVAAKLARFYQDAEPSVTVGDAYRDLLRREIQMNQRDLVVPGSPVELEQAEYVINRQLEIVERDRALFDRRARDGHVVEGHGDLRPEHICLQPDPAIIDCLEFDPRLRIVDPVDEMAFLAMQCERLGAVWVGPLLLSTYTQITTDNPPQPLISFYASYRAAIWSRLAVWRSRELSGDLQSAWIARAQTYLELALKHLRPTE